MYFFQYKLYFVSRKYVTTHAIEDQAVFQLAVYRKSRPLAEVLLSLYGRLQPSENFKTKDAKMINWKVNSTWFASFVLLLIDLKDRLM